MLKNLKNNISVILFLIILSVSMIIVLLYFRFHYTHASSRDDPTLQLSGQAILRKQIAWELDELRNADEELRTLLRNDENITDQDKAYIYTYLSSFEDYKEGDLRASITNHFRFRHDIKNGVANELIRIIIKRRRLRRSISDHVILRDIIAEMSSNYFYIQKRPYVKPR